MRLSYMWNITRGVFYSASVMITLAGTNPLVFLDKQKMVILDYFRQLSTIHSNNGNKMSTNMHTVVSVVLEISYSLWGSIVKFQFSYIKNSGVKDKKLCNILFLNSNLKIQSKIYF